MAIRATHTKFKTGATFPTAHHVLQPPVFRRESRQVTLKLLIYATAADFQAGKEPIAELSRTFDNTDFDALMTQIKNAIEPALIQRFFPGGTRVPD